MSERLQLMPGGPVSLPPDQIERFALALEAINESVYDWNVRTGDFEHLPLHHTSMRRWVDEPANADAWLAAIHPDDRPDYVTAVRAHLAGDTRRLACEYRYKANDGAWRWARQHGIAVRNTEGVKQTEWSNHAVTVILDAGEEARAALLRKLFEQNLPLSEAAVIKASLLNSYQNSLNLHKQEQQEQPEQQEQADGQ